MADFDAFVLTGGRSERMGEDKALLEIDGVPMAKRVANALQQAGAFRVTCVGGNRDALSALGLVSVVDEFEDAGPLGGILTALASSHAPVSVVAPCDLLEPKMNAFATLASALERTPDAHAAVPIDEDVWRPLPCALRSSAQTVLRGAFAAGERAVHRALAGLVRIEVRLGPMPDADSPEDLPGHR